jgi:hypothetical protein
LSVSFPSNTPFVQRAAAHLAESQIADAQSAFVAQPVPTGHPTPQASPQSGPTSLPFLMPSQHVAT